MLQGLIVVLTVMVMWQEMTIESGLTLSRNFNQIVKLLFVLLSLLTAS